MRNLLIFLLILLSTGCTSLRKLNSDYIELQRTPCFGPCLDYKLTLFENGHVVIKGSGFNTDKEKRKFSISQEKVNRIFSKIDSLNFFSFPSNIDDTCVSDMSDASKTIITVKKSSKKKIVREQECMVFYPDSYFTIKSFFSETELDSITKQNEIAIRYFEGFHSIAQEVDSISKSKKWVEELIKNQ